MGWLVMFELDQRIAEQLTQVSLGSSVQVRMSSSNALRGDGTSRSRKGSGSASAEAGWPKAIIAWIICYIYSVAQNHTLHRNFTFFTSDNKYFPELFRAYIAYSLGLFVSTANHAFLTHEYAISHQLSWIVSTALSIICNYIMLRFFVFKINKIPAIKPN